MSDPERVRALLARHGLPAAEPVLSPAQGEVNRTYLAGRVVVRLALAEKNDAIQDWRTERLVHPYVHAHGVSTPRLVAWGEHYTIVEWVEGRTMDADAPAAFFRDLGRQLARLHALPPPEDPEGALDDLQGPAPIDLDRLTGTLRPLAERVAAYADVPGGTFVHGDLMPGNVIVGPQGRAALIDWGDAGNGHPAYDLAFVPLLGIEATLEGYEAAGGRIDVDLRPRLVALRLEAVAYRMGEGDASWMDEALAHQSILERIAA